MRLKYLLMISALMSFSAFAINKNNGNCNFIHGLSSALNMQNYQQCSDKINSCPKVNKLTFDKACVSKVIRTEKACQQLDKIAHYLAVSPDQIVAQKKGNMVLLDISFSADGGQQYYILSPNGCLIATNVDPRKLRKDLMKQYAQSDFYIDNHGEPRYTNDNGIQRFTADIDAKKQCRACEVVATAEINFDFNKNGTWVKTSVSQFQAK